MNHFRVAAGILLDAEGKVLITERIGDGEFRGLWEFPGGKIDTHESPAEALVRELAEELGIEVTESHEFMQLSHEYADRTVEIQFFLISAWQNEPRGCEGQLLRWVPTARLDVEALLPADEAVVEALRQL